MYKSIFQQKEVRLGLVEYNNNDDEFTFISM